MRNLHKYIIMIKEKENVIYFFLATCGLQLPANRQRDISVRSWNRPKITRGEVRLFIISNPHCLKVQLISIGYNQHSVDISILQWNHKRIVKSLLIYFLFVIDRFVTSMCHFLSLQSNYYLVKTVLFWQFAGIYRIRTIYK